jgi:hypothetical protein
MVDLFLRKVGSGEQRLKLGRRSGIEQMPKCHRFTRMNTDKAKNSSTLLDPCYPCLSVANQPQCINLSQTVARICSSWPGPTARRRSGQESHKADS